MTNTISYRGQPTKQYSGSEPPIYDPLTDFNHFEMVGLKVFVWSREAEDEYAGIVTDYDPSGWPMYVVEVDEEAVKKFDAPKRITFAEGPFTESGSYRIVGAIREMPDERYVVIELGNERTPLIRPCGETDARQWLRTFQQNGDKSYAVRRAIDNDADFWKAHDDAIDADEPAPRPSVIPGEVFMALVTRRPELAKLLRANVKAGKVLTPEEVDGILTLAESTIEAEAALVATIAAQRKRLKDMVSNAAGLTNALNRMIEELDTHGSNVGGQGGRE